MTAFTESVGEHATLAWFEALGSALVGGSVLDFSDRTFEAALHKLPWAVNAELLDADWETRLVEKLPEVLEGVLPTVEQIEAESSAKKRRRR